MLVTGKEWTQEGMIIAALVNRLGGKVVLTLEEYKNVEGLIMDNSPDGGIRLEASSPPPKPDAYVYYSLTDTEST